MRAARQGDVMSEAKTWSERCKAVRKRLGLTQAAAAKRVDCHLAAWQFWEQGRYEPNKFYRRLIEILEKTQK